MIKDFSNQVAIVTGGSRGIGLSISEQFCKRGAHVVILDIDAKSIRLAEENLEQKGYAVETKRVDVTKREEVANVVQEIYETYGAIHILVNNAGIIRDNLLFKMNDEDWQQVLDVHLNGAFLMSQAVQTYMVLQRYGRIINLSSTSALGNRGQANYAAAKAGIQGFTKTLAIELGPFGITVNCVAPGFIETDMTRKTAERIGVSFEQFVAEGEKKIPVKRIGQPADVAHAVTFFADRQSSFINGQVLYVAGGPRN